MEYCVFEYMHTVNRNNQSFADLNIIDFHPLDHPLQFFNLLCQILSKANYKKDIGQIWPQYIVLL